MRPAGAAMRRQVADLRRLQGQALRVEALAERRVHRAVAVPAQFEHHRLEAGHAPARRRALPTIRWRGRPRRDRGRRGRTTRTTRRGPRPWPGASRPHRPVPPRSPGSVPPSQATRQPTVPRAHHRHPVARRDGRVPHAVDGGFHVGGEHGALGRHARRARRARRWPARRSGSGADRARTRRGRPASSGPCSDASDARVAELQRAGEVAGLKRRPHPLVFFGRDASMEHGRFGAAADAAIQRLDDDVAGAGRGHALRRAAPRGRAPPSRTRALCRSSVPA